MSHVIIAGKKYHCSLEVAQRVEAVLASRGAAEIKDRLIFLEKELAYRLDQLEAAEEFVRDATFSDNLDIRTKAEAYYGKYYL